MKKAFVVFSLLFLAACGFEPVYGTIGRDAPNASTTTAESGLEQVSIGNIPDFEGQYLRNELIDRFYRSGRPANPRYTLNVAIIRESRADLDITKTANTTRAQLRLDTGIDLIDNTTGDIVMSRKVRSVTSYNILASEFATRVSEENTRENALNDLARQITQYVSLYFDR